MSKLLSPATGTITSGYGPRKSPGGIGSTNHRGVDIARGSLRVQAPTDGTVVVSGYNVYRGNYVQIDHGNGVRTLHQHLAKRNVVKGQRVTAGQTIGTMGRTGLATGVHLHTEVTINAIIVNPSTWYAQHGVRIATSDQGTFTVAKPAASGGSGALKVGSKGARVGKLQKGFRDVFPGYRHSVALRRRRLIVVDNDFGPETDAWVREFQRRTGITIDGIVGPETLRELAKYGIHI